MLSVQLPLGGTWFSPRQPRTSQQPPATARARADRKYRPRDSRIYANRMLTSAKLRPRSPHAPCDRNIKRRARHRARHRAKIPHRARKRNKLLVVIVIDDRYRRSLTTIAGRADELFSSGRVVFQLDENIYMSQSQSKSLDPDFFFFVNPLTTAHFVTHRSYHTAGIVLRCAPRTANFWVGMHNI